MIEIFQYTFFQNALWAVLLISIAGALIGTYIVNRRMVFITGGITHASFGGLGLGFYMGWNPTLAALAFAVLSALGVEHMARRDGVREDSAIAVFWALGMAIGIIFIFLTPGYTPGLSEFLFGNILTVTHTDLALFLSFTTVLLLFFIFLYRPVLYVSFDRNFAKTRHIPVRAIEYTLMFFVSVCVVLAIQLVGIMLLLSLLTLPQMFADLFSSRFSKQIFLSCSISVVSGFSGLWISTLLNVPAGACIVFTLVAVYFVGRVVAAIRNWMRDKSRNRITAAQ